MNIVFCSVGANDIPASSVRFGTNTGRVSQTEGNAMRERKLDRRVERTRQLLSQALLALIQEKGFDALTVQDIIDRANVGRSTFYAHFDDKEDLLVEAMDPFSKQLKQRQREALRSRSHSRDGAFAFARELFAHADSHRDVFRAMVGKQSAAIVQRHFQRLQVELIREELKAVFPRGPGDVPPEALVQYVASALYGLLVWWMEGKGRMTVDEVDGLFRRMTLAAIKAAGG
jgi:AcrR family transcriptional regulator